jgi:hypothetical protein
MRRNNASAAPRYQESPHRDYPDDRYDIFSPGIFYDLDAVDVPIQRSAGEFAESR